MLSKNLILVVVGLAVIVGLFIFLNPSQIGTPGTKVFEVKITNRSLNIPQVSVSQDNTVVFKIITDEAGEFHLAGYEIEQDVDPRKSSELIVVANITGRYNIEFHPESEPEEDIVVGSFVVNPK